jgi:hypothetical protein
VREDDRFGAVDGDPALCLELGVSATLASCVLRSLDFGFRGSV